MGMMVPNVVEFPKKIIGVCHEILLKAVKNLWFFGRRPRRLTVVDGLVAGDGVAQRISVEEYNLVAQRRISAPFKGLLRWLPAVFVLFFVLLGIIGLA